MTWKRPVEKEDIENFWLMKEDAINRIDAANEVVRNMMELAILTERRMAFINWISFCPTNFLSSL